MKILLVNKFLYQKGGAETYVFKLGEILEGNGHTVEYFGLQNKKNIVGNNANSYVTDMDFSQGILKNFKALFRLIYNREAKLKLRKVLYDFKPDIIHLNNIQFHLTPSIILESEKYRKRENYKLKIIYTAHDYQLVCPSHGFFDGKINICEKCLSGNYFHCLKGKCIKNSRIKSFFAMLDAFYWKLSSAYSFVDSIICPSAFLKSKLDTQDKFKDKTIALHNFIEPMAFWDNDKADYILEFGHLSADKGTYTLLEAAKRLTSKKFVFAGFGKAVEDIKKLPNAEYVGFKTGEELKKLIAKALCSVYPSMWYENCPYSVIESQMLLTPVIGANIGGIPELIENGKTGELFVSGNVDDLVDKIKKITDDKKTADKYSNNCRNLAFETPETYYNKLIAIYEGKV